MQALDLNGKGNFPRIPWFWRNWPGFYSLGPTAIWLCCYMTSNLDLPNLVWHNWDITLCAVLSNIFPGIDTENRSKLSNFAMEPLSRLWLHKDTITFSAMKSLQ